MTTTGLGSVSPDFTTSWASSTERKSSSSYPTTRSKNRKAQTVSTQNTTITNNIESITRPIENFVDVMQNEAIINLNDEDHDEVESEVFARRETI